ncbi:RsmB/NOP family class I SAM-dependent RNA methyltransferase [Candidatus Woesearchaeota archaeon]|nr:RsmB/NOP family class I SAM-dependent RNA methyltransferase [Candidatus Woesearchaeota archaeon]MBW3018110.1 RsmB/NOP family class I SAM-dependent RNA methyltransferase [Candidatus Woesearchaeota archaeon]
MAIESHDLRKWENIPEIVFKPAFIERYSALTDFDKFKEYSLSYLRRSIRVNTLKSTVAEVRKRLLPEWDLVQVPWCKEGFWLENKKGRRDVGNLVEHALGYVYVQEAASMIPPLVLDPKPGEHVLDMCAAPGSKTSQIAQYMKNKGVLVANDISAARAKPLGLNLQRCGVTNLIITMMHGQSFKNVLFDKILVDAPCSGTGTIRKSLKTVQIWNPGMIRRLSHIQKQLIVKAFDILKKGGTMVYSTCSCEPLENEAVVSHLLETVDNATVEKIELKGIVRSPAVMEFEGQKYDKQVSSCLRIWPQDNDTEGFFVAKIKKK